MVEDTSSLLPVVPVPQAHVWEVILPRCRAVIPTRTSASLVLSASASSSRQFSASTSTSAILCPVVGVTFSGCRVLWVSGIGLSPISERHKGTTTSPITPFSCYRYPRYPRYTPPPRRLQSLTSTFITRPHHRSPMWMSNPRYHSSGVSRGV